MRGIIADDLHGAFQEADAISRGTRCKNFLFSLSLSPPEQEVVPASVFEAAIEQIEERLGLSGQPRAIVFHEKEGRRHAHAVWSRIDPVEMKAVHLSHYKRKLNEIARELYLEHGWDMPDGFKRNRSRDPLTFTLAEWQQAKRAGRDPKQLKAQIQECWKASDTKATFENALQDNGFFLAQGDRRCFVVLDVHGEVYSLSRLTGTKVKELKARLGNPKDLPTLEERKVWLSERMTDQLKAHIRELEQRQRKKGLALEFQRKQMVDRHRHARQGLKFSQAARWQEEERKRAARLPRGFKGLWSWITGGLKKVQLQNALEVAKADERDRAQRQAMIAKQLSERRALQKQIKALQASQQNVLNVLSRDVARYMLMGGKAPMEVTKVYEKDKERDRKRQRERDQDRPQGPEFEL
ncbi:MAG: relaxase/mobilization nuclease domain-containing protein [Pseudomonadota bacterium]